MLDKKLNLLLKISACFLAASLIFCVSAILYSKSLTSTDETEEVRQSAAPTVTPTAAPTPLSASDTDEERLVIVLDPGHGKPSSEMSDDEKRAEGYEYNENEGGWGEWRHYKDGTFGDDCHGEDCTHLAPEGGSCWYPIGNGDRDTEPDINLNNALAAKARLEELGFEVRMTRTTNDENPSMNKRVSYCFPMGDITQPPDASAYICIHSNAGGGRGSSYIALEPPYTQKYISADFTERSNEMGRSLNAAAATAAQLGENAPINSPYLILFNKCPVPIAYLEIGFYDDASDLALLRSSSDEIGRAIANAAYEFLKNGV